MHQQSCNTPFSLGEMAACCGSTAVHIMIITDIADGYWQHTHASEINHACATQTPPAGLEPAIFGLEVRRLVH